MSAFQTRDIQRTLQETLGQEIIEGWSIITKKGLGLLNAVTLWDCMSTKEKTNCVQSIHFEGYWAQVFIRLMTNPKDQGPHMGVRHLLGRK